jgi:hypothetical protein
MKPRSSIWSASSSTRWRTGPGPRPRVHQVDQAAGRGDEDVGAARERVDLAADGLAADDGVDLQAGRRGQPEAFGDLVGQLAGRREDQRLRRLGRRLARLIQQRVDQRQAEGQRLAGAGLGEAQDVMALQRMRDRLRLDRGGFG